MIEPMLSLAISMYSSKGVYALLLGSGISRSAKIPTGWEIIVDLIYKLAYLENVNCEPDPEAWFVERYGEEPNYSKLLEAIAKTSSERNFLLKRYIEPDEQEREQGSKLPMPAHHAIAKLVAGGYIKVILTTNFDHLLEDALRAIGIEPQVISTPGAIEGAIPIVHSQCTIIKLHGDYLDPYFKNTTAELETYDDRLNRYLDRILDEFGLIVCGWSAQWDTALKAAIERCPNRRFTTYWCDRGRRTDEAQRLINFRQAELIKIKDADSFFQELEEKVSALEHNDRPHPLSAKVAVETIKKYLVDERYKIRLYDFVMQEVEKVCHELSSQEFSLNTTFNPDAFKQRVKRYESITEIIVALTVNGCYWRKEFHQYLWVKCLDRIIHPSNNGLLSYNEDWYKLSLYPALILFYAGGMAAIAAESYKTLFALLMIKVRNSLRQEEKPVALVLNTWKVMEKNISWHLPNVDRHHTPLSDYLYNLLREPLRDFLAQDIQYQKCFDRFEFLLALIYADLELRYQDRQLLYGYVPIGSFGWRRQIVKEIELEATQASQNWLPLKAGLFGGSIVNFENAFHYTSQRLSKLSWF